MLQGTTAEPGRVFSKVESRLRIEHCLVWYWIISSTPTHTIYEHGGFSQEQPTTSKFFMVKLSTEKWFAKPQNALKFMYCDVKLKHFSWVEPSDPWQQEWWRDMERGWKEEWKGKWGGWRRGWRTKKAEGLTGWERKKGEKKKERGCGHSWSPNDFAGSVNVHIA